MIHVKICGITRVMDGIFAARAGADLLGFNFYLRSPRYLEPEQARDMVSELREKLDMQAPMMVGIFVNELPSTVAEIMQIAGLDYAQLSGDEPPTALAALNGVAFKGLRAPDRPTLMRDVARYAPLGPNAATAPGLLLDAYHPKLYGGSGQRADWAAAAEVTGRVQNLMLAGGLKPHNVAQAVRHVRPWGVDVASGVEIEPGVKDAGAVRAFIRTARFGAREEAQESRGELS